MSILELDAIARVILIRVPDFQPVGVIVTQYVTAFAKHFHISVTRFFHCVSFGHNQSFFFYSSHTWLVVKLFIALPLS